MSFIAQYDEAAAAYVASRQEAKKEAKKAVFGRGRHESRNPFTRIGLSGFAGGSADRDPEFRRTEADRRPARVVRMENDGPAPDREAKAAALLAEIEAKAPKRVVTTERRDAMLRELLKGPRGTKDLAAALGFSGSNTSEIASAAAADGLVTKTRTKGLIGMECIISLTDAGRAHVTERRAA